MTQSLHKEAKPCDMVDKNCLVDCRYLQTQSPFQGLASEYQGGYTLEQRFEETDCREIQTP